MEAVSQGWEQGSSKRHAAARAQKRLSEDPLEPRPALGRHLLRPRAQWDACAGPTVLTPVEKTESSRLLQEDIDYSLKVYGCRPKKYIE